MNTPGTAAPGRDALELPPFLSMCRRGLGGGVKAVGLELVGTENRSRYGQGCCGNLVGGLPCPCRTESYVVDFLATSSV